MVLITVCESMCAILCIDSPRLHAALQSLQTGFDQVKRLEKQRGAGPTEGAAHEGLDGWVSLRGERRYGVKESVRGETERWARGS